MKQTLVIQSHRTPLPFNWLKACLESVQQWATNNHFDYRFIGDEIFASLDPSIIEKTQSQKVIASDLARLKAIQQALMQGYHRVVWCDADFLIFNPQAFVLPETSFALGREVWVQRDDRQKLRAYTKVHNAFMVFSANNHFLDYYTASAEQLIQANQGGMPPQFVGPKLLTALHNIVACPVMETAGMLSPLVIEDILKGGGKALKLFEQKSACLPAGANLSSSVTAASGFGETEMTSLIEQLKGPFFSSNK